MSVHNEKTDGQFKTTANFAQTLKDDFRTGNNWNKINDMQKEALDAIAVKLARILSGDAGFRDHWVDIAEAANLAASNASPSMPQVTADLSTALGLPA